LTDLQRLAVRYGIRLPPSFALVGKTLAQADSIARVLDPELDPIDLLREQALELMVREGERRLEPAQLLAFATGQMQTLSRLPTRLGQVADRLEAGTLKVGVVPADLDSVESMIRSVANRLGAALIIVG